MPTWLEDLAAGGYLGRPFVWTADGTCTFDDSISAADRQAIEAIFAGHPDERPFTVGPPAPISLAPPEGPAPGDQG